MWLWLCQLAFGAPGPEPAPTERMALVLVRALSYDRAIGRETGELRIAVVYAANAPVGREVIEVLGGLRGVTVSGREIGAPVGIPVSATTDVATQIAGFDTVLLCPGIDASLAPLVEAARRLDVSLLSLDPAYVGQGAALGVSIEGTRLRLRVDRAEATEQGAEFTAELLDLAVHVDARRAAPP
jgi:hypothetical protein